MAYLTILTRSFRRPECLARCVDSVARQTDPDVEQIILHDPIGRGVGQSYLDLRYLWPRGDYVYLLDDDDYLIDPDFVAALKRHTEHSDVIFVGMDIKGRVLPDWSEGLRRGNIAVSCFVVRREVWMEHARDLLDDYSADFYLIEAIMKCARGHTHSELGRVVVRADRISNGRAENLYPVA